MASERVWCKLCGGFVRSHNLSDASLAEIRKLPVSRPLKSLCDDCVARGNPPRPPEKVADKPNDNE